MAVEHMNEYSLLVFHLLVSQKTMEIKREKRDLPVTVDEQCLFLVPEIWRAKRRANSKMTNGRSRS